VQSATSVSNHVSIYLSLSFYKFPDPVNFHLRSSLLSFRNMSLVLPGTWSTNFCSTILGSFQNLFFKLILCSIILKSFQNTFFQLRTQVTLCCVHNMVLDDVNNMAHLSTTTTVLSPNSIFHLAIHSSKSFLFDLFHYGLSEFWLRKHSNLIFI
jgi:hypothetical protein